MAELCGIGGHVRIARCLKAPEVTIMIFWCRSCMHWDILQLCQRQYFKLPFRSNTIEYHLHLIYVFFILLSLPIHFLFSCTVFLLQPKLLCELLPLDSVFYHLFFFQDFDIALERLHVFFYIYAVHVLVKNQFAFLF